MRPGRVKNGFLLHVTKGSFSYLGSLCFSNTILGVVGGYRNFKCRGCAAQNLGVIWLIDCGLFVVYCWLLLLVAACCLLLVAACCTACCLLLVAAAAAACCYSHWLLLLLVVVATAAAAAARCCSLLLVAARCCSLLLVAATAAAIAGCWLLAAGCWLLLLLLVCCCWCWCYLFALLLLLCCWLLAPAQNLPASTFRPPPSPQVSDKANMTLSEQLNPAARNPRAHPRPWIEESKQTPSTQGARVSCGVDAHNSPKGVHSMS